MRNEVPSILSIQVQGQRARKHENLPVHRFRRITIAVITDISNPFARNPQTIGSPRYFGKVKIRK